MKLKAIVIVLTALMLATAAFGSGTQWKGKFGIGIRGPFIAPLFEGSDFELFGESYEPYALGWNGTLELRYGLSEKWVASLFGSYASSFDDSTATSDRSFAFAGSGDAFTRIEGGLFGLTGSYYFREEERTQPFVLAGFGVDYWLLNRRVFQSGDFVYQKTDLNIKLGGGLSYWINDNMTFDGQLRFTYVVANLNSNLDAGVYGPGDWSEGSTRPFRGYLEPAIGFTYYLGGGPDTDKDGVGDDKDQCPNTPRGARVDKVGCPLDSDGDGVYDGLDLCPNTPAGARVDGSGCPIDTDEDGVFDGLDKCPGTPAGVTVDQFGCPLDEDKDGVPDYQDECPGTPAGAPVDAKGCPLDSDGDGVADYLDQCPNTPAGTDVDDTGCPYDADFDGVPDSVDQCLGTPRDVAVDETGCPVAKRITTKIVLSDNVQYSSGSFELTPAAMKVLDGVAESMKAYPETKIRISGYTDSQGSEAFNLTLSKNRAEAVMMYLRDKGVSMGRMSTVGHGEDPRFFVGDNDTPEGRAKNRRVEIETVE